MKSTNKDIEKVTSIQFESLLAPRIIKNCLPLFGDGHFRHAAREAMVQVELALKVKGRVENNQFGVNLISSLFDGKNGVKLRVPFGDSLQEQAKKYFIGVFKYYRNYSAHDGGKIDEKISLRILIIASELLELINASELTLTDLGGIKELVKIGGFGNPDRLINLLSLLDGYHMPEGTYDGLFENLASKGFSSSELESVIELGLIEMHSKEYEDSRFCSYTDVIEWFELTELGEEICVEKSNSKCKS